MGSQYGLEKLPTKNYIFICVLLALLSITCKIIPHLPNFSPQIIVCLYLGRMLPKRFLLASILCVAMLSDVAAAWVFGFDIFGAWSIFTYSAFIAIGFSGYLLKFSTKYSSLIATALLSSLGFWVWTNFGVWLCDGLYAKSLFGLMQCYLLALPFLGYALWAAIAWVVVVEVVLFVSAFISNTAGLIKIAPKRCNASMPAKSMLA